VKLPTTPEDLTPAWLTWALAPRYPDAEVTRVDIVDINAGTATKVRIRVHYNAAGERAGLPPTLIVKAPFGKNVDDMEHTFTHELYAYRDLVSDIGLNTPMCYFAVKEGKNPVLILEDLATPDCRFGSSHEPLGFADAASVLDMLAIMHARYWNHPALQDDNGELGWVLRTVTGWHYAYMKHVVQPHNWAFYTRLPRGAALPHALASDPARVERAMEAQFAFHRTQTLTLGHGDAHIQNLYFNRHGAGLLDWEMRRCPWFHDVTYFLGSSLDVVDRRRWEKPLLQHYLMRLAHHGVPAPGFDEAFYCYRREMIYGYIIFVTNGDGTQFWSEADNAAVAVRFGMAIEDLDTMSAITQERAPTAIATMDSR
jgi:Ecdysteroid kinase-like family